NYLHDKVQAGDVIELGPPCGEFTLDIDKASGRPIVLISGGVGVTPILSMLKTLAASAVETPVFFIHGAINSRTHAFADEVKQVLDERPNVTVHIRYSEPLPWDVAEGRCDDDGIIDAALIRSLVPDLDANFY